MNGEGAGGGIGRRQFLKAAAVLWGFLGGGMSGIAGAMERDREGATGDMRVLGCSSDAPARGYFDGSTPPVLRIRSGDTVVIETGTHPAGGMAPAARAEDWNRRYKEEMAQSPDAYFSPGRAQLVGPIHVEGAEPGDILQVEILEPADDFTGGRVEWRRVQSSPGASGARLPDEGERIDGTALHFPVRVKGAGVVTGDIRFARAGGGVEGFGPAEGYRSVTLRMTVRKELKKGDRPCFSAPGHWIALGIRADRREARGKAVRKALRFLDAGCLVPEDEGYAFCSMGAERHVTQYVKRHAILTCYAPGSCSAK